MNSIGGCQTRPDVDLVAIVRPVSNTIADCQLTHLPREPIDLIQARKQHADYVEALRNCGCEIVEVAVAHECPDAVFVEDLAVVVDEVAIMTRPGAPSRRSEATGVQEMLEQFRTVQRIEEPATLDGGDVMQLADQLWIGLSTRTTEDGAAQLDRELSPHGYTLNRVIVRECLHLKSACCAVGQETVLYNPAWIDASLFSGLQCLAVDPTEAMAANVVSVAGRVLVGAHFPRTADRLDSAGFVVELIESDELAKAEGALTCCSIILKRAG